MELITDSPAASGGTGSILVNRPDQFQQLRHTAVVAGFARIQMDSHLRAEFLRIQLLLVLARSDC